MRRFALLAVALAVVGCEESTGSVSGKLSVFRGSGEGEGAWQGPDARRPVAGPLADPAVRAQVGAGLRAQVRPLLTAPRVKRIVPGDVIVRLEEARVAPEWLLAKAALPGLKAVHRGHASRWLHLLEYRHADGAPLSEAETLAAVAAVGKLAGVRFAEANVLQYPSAIPDDRLYAYQWHYPMMNLPAAWDVTSGSEVVVVAVVDTGVTSHPELAARLAPGIDMISDAARALDGNGRDDDPTDPGKDLPQSASSWHGTHVAGTIGAASDNGRDVTAVDWHARVLPVRVLGKGGGTLFDIAAGITWAAGGEVPGSRANATPAKVVNMSLGGTAEPQRTYQDAIDFAVQAGAIVVVAAGNEDENTLEKTPCNQDRVVCVGATRHSGARASYSNFGAQVDVMAPGGELSEDANGDDYPDGVLSTFREGTGGSVQFLQGTSMASPHVAGLVALMKALSPAMTHDQVEAALKETSAARARCSEGCGAGLVNAYAAVLRARGGQQPTGPAKLALSSSELVLTAGAQAVVGVSNVGGQPMQVTATLTGEHAARLSLVDAATFTVAPGATGALTVKAQAAGLPEEVLAAELLVTTDGGTGRVTVRLDGRQRSSREEAVVAVVFEDPEGDWQVAAGAIAKGADGFTWRAEEVPEGSYFVLAAIDSDADGEFLEGGEPWGMFRDFASPSAVDVTAGAETSDVSFTLVPFEAVDQAPASFVGAGCASNADCGEGGLCLTDWPDGYCTKECTSAACPGGEPCYGGDDGKYCFASCAAPDEGQSTCRGDYVCYADAGGSLCYPVCDVVACGEGSTCDESGYCI